MTMPNRRPVGAALSPAQRRALGAYLDALLRGEGGRRAAADCGIAYQTFRTHLGEAYRRLDATNAIQAVVQLGFMRWDPGFPPGGRSERLVSREDYGRGPYSESRTYGSG
jgi:hypothetical protein